MGEIFIKLGMIVYIEQLCFFTNEVYVQLLVQT